MKRILPLIALCLILSGCASSVAHQLDLSRQAFDAALDAQHAAYHAGLITSDEIKQALPIERSIAAALDAGQRAAALKDTATAEKYLAAAEAGLQKYSNLAPKPTTAPGKSLFGD